MVLKKMRWILGFAIAFVALLLQVIPATSMLIAEGGALWILMTIALVLVAASCVFGFLCEDKPFYEQARKPHRIAHDVALFLPLLFAIIRAIVALSDILSRAGRGDPDVFSNVGAILSAGFFIVLVLVIALPIAGWVMIGKYSGEDTYVKNGETKKKKMSGGAFRMITVPIIAVVLVAVLAVTVAANMFPQYLDNMFGRGERHVVSPEGTESWDTDYYGETLTPEKAKENALKVLNNVTDEGMILLKNNGVLPLEKNSAVTPFGKGYVFPFFDSPGTDSSMKHSFDYSVYPKTALEAKFKVISYAADLQPKTTTTTGSTSNGNSNFDTYPDKPNAAPGTRALYNDKGEVINNFGANSLIPELSVTRYGELSTAQKTEMNGSVALVFISRSGSENADLKFDGYDDGTPHYLALTKNEKDMIKKAKELCSKVVVLVNSTNPVELGPVMSGECEADAILWVGNPGETGFDSMAGILCGEVNPSGRTYDILARDFLKGPEMANFGDFEYSNLKTSTWGIMSIFTGVAEESPAKYVEYAEGVYMGYRYYETAHDIGAKNFTYGKLDGKGGVAEEGAVCYPFGYGLSYSKFDQSIVSYSDSGDKISLSVKVVNNGAFDGKEVVQVYFNPPYTEYDRNNGVEKPTATLCAFAKTGVIKAGGGSETVNLEFSKEELTSFNASRDNGDGTKGCYMLEEGTYEISLRKNSHEIIEKREFTQGQTVFYDNTNPRVYEKEKQALLDDEGNMLPEAERSLKDPSVGFTAAVSLFPYMDEYMKEMTTPLTRANWDETVPVYTPRADFNVSPKKELKQKFVDLVNERNNFDAETNKQLGNMEGSKVYADKQPTSKQDNGLKVSDMRGKDYYDENWEKLLDELNWEKDGAAIQEFILSSNYYTPEIESIGLPNVKHTEGANGIRVASSKSDQQLTVTWCMCPVMAATWNVELAEDIGSAMAAEALANGVTSRYSPAFNTHRSPFTGRNMEYFSEDPFLTGMFVTNMLNGSTTGGLIEHMKHFGLNDQETNRNWMHTWASEQTVREIYNKPFEMCIRNARKTIKYIADDNGTVKTKVMRGATGMMVAQNAFGPCIAHVNYDLVTELVRNEWNFQGVINTDWQSPFGDKTDYTGMVVRAGVDCWLTGNSCTTSGSIYGMPISFALKDTESATARTAYREAIHHIAFQIANSNAMQGVAPGAIVYYDMSPWKVLLIVGNVIAYTLIAGGIVWIVLRALREKKYPEQYMSK